MASCSCILFFYLNICLRICRVRDLVGHFWCSPFLFVVVVALFLRILFVRSRREERGDGASTIGMEKQSVKRKGSVGKEAEEGSVKCRGKGKGGGGGGDDGPDVGDSCVVQ